MGAGVVLCLALLFIFGCLIKPAMNYDAELPISHTGKKTRR